MKTLLLLLLLVCGVMSAYNITRAKNMAYACGATYGTEAEINAWNCTYCSAYKLTNVSSFRQRPKRLTTRFWTPSDSLASLPMTMPSSLPLEAQSAFKTGLSTLTSHKYLSRTFRSPIQDAQDAMFTKDSILPLRGLKATSEYKFKDFFLFIGMLRYS